MIFQQSPPGYKNINGPLVQQIQTALTNQGYDTQGIDGLWGGNTASALRQWQKAKGMDVTAVVDDAAWTALLALPVPAISQRALQLTGDWEGTHYGGSNGNFDGEGITWGVLGFTWGNGELQGILQEIQTRHPNVFTAAFGAQQSEILAVLGQPFPAQMAWARNLSINNGNAIAPPWSAAFSNLGAAPEVQQIENEHAQHYWNAGVEYAQTFGLQSEAGMCLCFDIATQNKVTDEMIGQIHLLLAPIRGDEPAMMRAIANVIADHASSQFKADVLSRKMTFATGQGRVHGDNYDIKSWGIG